MLKGLTQEEYSKLVRSVGTRQGRRKLSPNEISQLLAKAKAAGATVKECAEELSVGSTIITAFLKLQKIDGSLRYRAGWGKVKEGSIPFSTIAHIANLSLGKQRQATDSTLKYSMTEKEVRNLVQLVERSKKSFNDCVREIMDLRPKIEKQYLFIGGIADESIKKVLLTKTQEERDVLMVRVMSRIDPRLCSIHPRLGEKEFSITADHKITEFFNGSLDDLEVLVNDKLLREV